MLKNLRKIFTKVWFTVLLIGYFIYPSLTYAETHVYPEDVKEMWSWTKAGSPYILEDNIYIPDGYHLTITEEVEVISAPTEGDPHTLIIDGDMSVHGTKENPVKFTDLNTITFASSISHIGNAIFKNTGLQFTNSTSNIEFSTIKDSFDGIRAEGSHIDISTSTITNNSYGIASYFFQRMQPMLMRSTVPVNQDVVVDSHQNVINIHESRIFGNTNYQILNEISNPVYADNNWWGRESGPTDNDNSGSVFYEPWKTKDPEVVDDDTPCCSNVLFIPGIEASRLYKDTKGFLGTSTNTLWEPNINADVKKLYMDSNGISLDKSIYTKDIIDTALGVKNIYKSFIESMDSLVTGGSINKWSAFPYDWRNGAYDVVDNSLVEKVYDLASTSKNKKVTIIAHSNGGLVTKALMKKLESLGKDSLIENIIFVAVPELGTPEAIFSMLNGHNQSIVGGAILSENNARTFSQNVPGAYGLLPSQRFFEKNPINVVTDFFKNNIKISSFEGMRDFIINNSFSKKSSTDTSVPLLLNDNLFTKNTLFHSTIDNWKSTSTINSLSIFGWGLPTSEGVKYKKDIHCDDINKCPIESSSILTILGDGTVITKSNSGNSNSTLFLDLDQIGKDKRGNVNHANIFESIDLLAKLKDLIIKKKPTTTTPPPTYEKYFSTTEPVDTDMYLTVEVHSPLDIDVYDKEGRHTGLIENPTYDLYENEIPGSYYGNFGRVKMIMVHYDPDTKIVLKGNDTGVFIIESSVSIGDKVIASTTFAELPVIASTNIELIIPSSIDNFASSTMLNIDIEGDGTVDFVGHTNTYLNSTSTSVIKDMPTYIESVRKIILSLKLPSIEEKRWMKRLDKITELLDKNKFKKADKVSKKLLNKKFKLRKLTDEQREVLLKTFENLISDIETYYVPKIDSKGKL